MANCNVISDPIDSPINGKPCSVSKENQNRALSMSEASAILGTPPPMQRKVSQTAAERDELSSKLSQTQSQRDVSREHIDEQLL